MVRFHGRNRDTWEAKGLASSAHRFDYYYPPSELEEWVPKVEMTRENASEVHLVVNTTEGAQAIKDSYSLRRTALTSSIAYVTTVRAARAAVDAIAACPKDGPGVRSLQDYYRREDAGHV